MALDQTLLGALVDGSPDAGWSTVRIYGRRLRKFSLWHKFLLKGISSPFMEKKPVTLFDLRNAVAVCCLEFPDSKIRRPWLCPTIDRLRLVATAVLTSGSKARKSEQDEDNLVQTDLRKNVDRYLFYTQDYIQQPEYAVIPVESSGSSMSPQIPRGRAPDDIELVGDLIAWTHWDDKKVWDLPIGYANWLRTMAIRDKGADIDFVTEKEREFRKTLPEEYNHG